MHFVTRFVLSFLLYGRFAPWVSGLTTQNAVLDDRIDAFINQVLTDWKSPGGVGVAVVRRDDQGTWNTEAKGYGVATANGSKVTNETLFSIGSNAKLFNIFAIGLLIHNETLSPRLSWTSKIASILPGWDLIDTTAAKHATITDVMTHRTGLPRHDFSYRLQDDVPTIISKMKFHQPSAEFRDIYQYNNNMYILLSHLPPLLLPDKTTFARYVKQHIFDALGMASTTYSYDKANASGRLADGMVMQRINESITSFNGISRALPFWSTSGGEDGNASGPGGVISNAVDMATWLQTLLLNGKKPGTNISVIPSDVVQKAATGVSVTTGAAIFPELSPVVYGAAQERGTYRGHEFIEHTGTVPGFNSVVTRLPFNNFGVVVLSNDNDYGASIARIIEARLLDEALSLEPFDWDRRFKAQASTPPLRATQRPTNASFPSANFTSLAGTYDNGGYGKFELCLVFPMHPAATPSCKELAANIPKILPGAVKSSAPTFFARWDGPSFSHIRFTHFNGNIFNVTGLMSYPTNNVMEPYWTFGDSDADTGIYAQTIVHGSTTGIGISGIWGAGTGVPSPQGTSARERAEVWFDKIN